MVIPNVDAFALGQLTEGDLVAAERLANRLRNSVVLFRDEWGRFRFDEPGMEQTQAAASVVEGLVECFRRARGATP
jgi:hypothetical protein